MRFVKRFEEASFRDLHLVGGKGASLGELFQRGIPVPDGFVVTTDAHLHYQSSRSFPDGLKEEIAICLRKIDASHFAVRSSATVEDASGASWAGQFESYLHIRPHEILDALEKCWQSAATDRVAAYGERQSLPKADISLAVVVQKMVPAVVSGVCFTVHPLLEDADKLFVEAVYGLCQPLVEGTVTPDMYTVDARAFAITEKTMATQEMQLLSVEGMETETPVDASEQSAQKLSDRLIVELCRLAKIIEAHYGKPQDIEWVFDGESIHIVQSRPITTL